MSPPRSFADIWRSRLRRFAVASIAVALAVPAWAQDQKPNILVIWGDDIGQSNISAYTMGLMGYRTPNIDRVANEGMIFTDYYGEQSGVRIAAIASFGRLAV